MAVALRVYAPRVRALALGAALHDVGKVAMVGGLTALASLDVDELAHCKEFSAGGI